MWLNRLGPMFLICVKYIVKRVKTRMTTFIKTKFNISDDQTNIDYRLAANITEYQNISKLILQ